MQKCELKHQELPFMTWSCKTSSEFQRVIIIHCWSQQKFWPWFQMIYGRMLWEKIVVKYVPCSLSFQFNGDWFFAFGSRDALVFLSDKSINMHGNVMTWGIFQLLLNNRIKVACANLTSSLWKPVSVVGNRAPFFLKKNFYNSFLCLIVILR